MKAAKQMSEAQKEARRARQRIANLSVERIERVREVKREHMRRKLAGLSAEEKKAYLAKRRERELDQQRERRANSPELRAKDRKVTVDYYHRNRAVCIGRQKVYRLSQKETVLDHYGRYCACCGEDEPIFLSLDHIKGDGAAHRRETRKRSGASMYALLIREGFPEGFQVLCFNCNFAKRTGHECPHRAIVKTRLTANVAAFSDRRA